MASVVINGDTSGGITLTAPAVAGSNTYTLAPATGNVTPLLSGTSVASTSGTSVDFILSSTIAPYVKRVTLMFSGVSTSGTSVPLIQVGTSSGIVSTGYLGTGCNEGGTAANSTAGFPLRGTNSASNTFSGNVFLTTIGSNIWLESGLVRAASSSLGLSSGDVTLAATLDRIRITTVNGTDTFDAGTINIMYEG